MRSDLLILSALLFSFILGCKKTEHKPTQNPTTVDSLAPNFFKDAKGNVFLNWMETPEENKTAIYFAKWENGQWGAKQKVAQGNNWFVNWADFPGINIHPDDANHWMAHWLQYTAEGTYDYEVRIVQSFDAGKNWTPSLVPHLDGVSAEHGFVSISPAASGSFRTVWLDGRFTKTAASEATHDHDSHGHGTGGPMTLRTALIDRAGKISASRELDNRVCDCCQTSMANVAGGPMVVYRDRSQKEIRDIAFVRAVGDKWTLPESLHADNWKITGCPVNGPVIRSHQQRVAIAWYTAANEKQQVNLKISNNGGITFDDPLRINIDETIGRVDLQINGDTIYMSWIATSGDDKAEVVIAKINSQSKEQQIIHRQQISPQRASGFPRLALLKDGDLLLAWTDVLEGSTQVITSLVAG